MKISSNNSEKIVIIGKEGEASSPAIPEIGGFADKKLPEPTRYGDWEVGGRCSDF